MEKATLQLSFADQDGNGLTDPVSCYGEIHAERLELTAGESHALDVTIRPERLFMLWINATEIVTLLAIDDAGELIREIELLPRRPLLYYHGIGVSAQALFERPVASLRVASEYPAIVQVRAIHGDEPPLELAEAVEKYAAPLVGAVSEPADLATAQAEPIKPGDEIAPGVTALRAAAPAPAELTPPVSTKTDWATP